MSALQAPERAPVRQRHGATAPVRQPGATRPGHLRVVRPDEPRRRPRVNPILGVALTALLFVGLIALAGAHALLVQGQIKLDGLAEELSAEQARYQQLRLEVAELESPERVVAVAQQRLGMVPPAQLVYLTPTGPAPTGADAAAGPDGAAPAEVAGDGTWAVIKPLLEAAAP